VPIVDAKRLGKSYGDHVVLGQVDVTIRTGERVGVVGDNGAGKSTLSRILAGLEAPDSGTVSRRRGASVLYLEQVPRFDGDPSAEQAVRSGLSAWSAAVARYEAVSRALAAGGGELETLLEDQTRLADELDRLGGWEQNHRVASLLGHLGIDRVDASISTLSGGEQRRVALARLLIARPDLAILDEPTNHLDAETIDWLEQYLLEEHQGALLLITHDRYLLDRVAERTLEIANGEVFSYDGGYELYLEQKAERLAHAQRTEQNRQNFLRRELEWLRRQPKARSTKQKARTQRAETAVAARAPRHEVRASLDIDVAPSGKTILELRELGIDFAGRELVSSFDLFLTEGERVGIVGRNGIGKTTLLRVVQGELPPTRGSVQIGKNTKIAYFDQERSALDDERSVYDNVVGDQPRIELAGSVIEPRSFLERFAFYGLKQRQPVGALSGGERARVALARMLRQSANLVILDEPTNDLDVATLGALESMLLEYAVTALIVTHDRWFLDRVATAIVAFEGDGRVLRYPGNFESYRRLRAQGQKRSEPPEPAEPERPPDRAPPAGKKKKRLTHAEERELAEVLERIAGVEARVLELERHLADPTSYHDGKDVRAEMQELDSAKNELEQLMLRWEELETKKG
jgi:ABC transport system ATP-binding/permease protein